MLNRHRVRCQGSLLMVGEASMSHWTPTTYFKLGSLQSIKCCLYLGMWGSGWMSNRWIYSLTPGKTKQKQKHFQFSGWYLECENYDSQSLSWLEICEWCSEDCIEEQWIDHCIYGYHSPSWDKTDSTGCVREDFTFFWHRKLPMSPENVVLVSLWGINSSTISCHPLRDSKEYSGCRLQIAVGLVSLISAYAPILSSCSEIKDKFYDDLSTAISRVCEQEPLIILWDLNTSVGTNHSSWP